MTGTRRPIASTAHAHHSPKVAAWKSCSRTIEAALWARDRSHHRSAEAEQAPASRSGRAKRRNSGGKLPLRPRPRHVHQLQFQPLFPQPVFQHERHAVDALRRVDLDRRRCVNEFVVEPRDHHAGGVVELELHGAGGADLQLRADDGAALALDGGDGEDAVDLGVLRAPGDGGVGVQGIGSDAGGVHDRRIDDPPAPRDGQAGRGIGALA